MQKVGGVGHHNSFSMRKPCQQQLLSFRETRRQDIARPTDNSQHGLGYR